MLDAVLRGFRSFWTWKNLGALVGLLLAGVFLAWIGWTPDRIAAMLPRPDELIG